MSTDASTIADTFAALAGALTEPALLVTTSGEILDWNAAALSRMPALASVGDQDLEPPRLQSFVDTAPADLAATLRRFAGSRSPVPAALQLRSPDGALAQFRAEGALVVPAQDQSPALLFLRLRGSLDTGSPFTALRRQIQSLNLEIQRRRAVEADLRRAVQERDDLLEVRARTEEVQRQLLGELSHRVKNILAVVSSVVRLSLREDRDPTASRDALLSRLRALARTHDLLSATEWHGVRLRTVLDAALEPHLDQVTVKGEDFVLSPKATQTLALVFHELASNAALHGALSRPGGRIAVEWAVDPEQGFRLTWIERNGPEIAANPRSGFGRSVIEQGVRYDLDARGTLCLETAGAEYELLGPQASVRVV